MRIWHRLRQLRPTAAGRRADTTVTPSTPAECTTSGIPLTTFATLATLTTLVSARGGAHLRVLLLPRIGRRV